METILAISGVCFGEMINRAAVMFLGFLSLLTSAGVAGQDLTLEQLIERNVQTMGGRSAIEAVQSIRFDLHIVDAGSEVDATYYAARPGRMRIDIIVDQKRVYTEAFDGKRAWQWKASGDTTTESETATNALRHGIELPGKLFGLHELTGRGNKLELIGREQVAEINYYLMRLTFPDKFSTALYLDPQTGLITRRRDVRPLHPDIDPRSTMIETHMSDFRKVDNLLFSFASTETDLKSGKVLEEAIVRKITLNPPIQPEFFERL